MPGADLMSLATTAITAANPVLGGFVSAAGSLLGAIGSASAAQAEKRRMRIAADQTNQQASVNAQSGYEDAQRQAASGFVTAADSGGIGGAAQGVLADFDRNSLFNERAGIYRGQMQANSIVSQGKVQAQNLTNQAIGQVFDAGSSVLGGFAKQRDQKARLSMGGA